MASKHLAGSKAPAKNTVSRKAHSAVSRGVLKTLDNIENMVVEARKVPFMDKIVINDNELVRYVDDLRRDLPEQMRLADQVLEQRDQLIAEAEHEAERIVTNAKNYAEKLSDESEIVSQAKEKAKAVLQQSQEQERAIMERAEGNAQQVRDNADAYARQIGGDATAYAKQVFDQLIQHVGATFQGIQQAQAGVQQAQASVQQTQLGLQAAIGTLQRARQQLEEQIPDEPAPEEQQAPIAQKEPAQAPQA